MKLSEQQEIAVVYLVSWGGAKTTLPQLQSEYDRKRHAMFLAHGAGTWPDSLVAQALDCSPETVKQWRRVNGLGTPRTGNRGRVVNAKRDKAIRKRRKAGESYESVGSDLGISANRVRQIDGMGKP